MRFLVLVIGLAGLAGLYTRLRPEFSRGITFITLALVAGATPLAWYTFVEPSLSDIALFAAVAWLVAVSRVPGTSTRHNASRAAAWIALAVLPLVLLWLTLSAEPAGATHHLVESRWLDVLFSSWHGFLSWTPVAYIGVIGTVAYLWRNRTQALAALLIVFATAWLIGATDDWMGGAGFGARRMTSLLAILAPGLAFALDWLRRRPVLAFAPLVAVPLMWNHLLMVQYTIGTLPKDEPVSFARMVRQQADTHLRESRVHPFAFPANMWFAWREGVPVDRYDLLSPEPRRTSVDIIMDPAADRFLLAGWDAPGKDDWGPMWWMTGRDATLVVPLVAPRDRDVTIAVRARTRLEEPMVEADLGLQVNGHDVGRFSPPATTPGDARLVVPAAEGRLIWRDGFNRLSIVSRGVHRVDPSDTRPPGPIGRRTGNPAWPVAVYRFTITPR